MRINRSLALVLALATPAILGFPVLAQQPAGAPAAPHPRAKPGTKPAPAKPPAGTAGESKPTLLGQYGDWGAYTANPGGKKICFAIAKPTSAETKPPNRPRNQPYMFITTRPSDKVVNEISVAIGYPFKSGSESTIVIGSTTYALYTEGDGAWIKNAAEESHMIDEMRSAESAVVKGVSSRGTLTTDTYSLRGIAQALDRVGQECSK